MIINEQTYEKLLQHEVKMIIVPRIEFIFATFNKDYCEVSICLKLSNPEEHNQQILSDLLDRFLICYEKYGYWKED